MAIGANMTKREQLLAAIGAAAVLFQGFTKTVHHGHLNPLIFHVF